MRRRRIKLGLAATGIVAALWLGGFAWFIALATEVAPAPPTADGIVALTGGSERIEVALRLLAEERGAKLLVSGIGGSLELPALARRAGLDPAPLADRVTLGRSATSTRGNALETAAWVRENNIRSLIVVTAYYHMPRAMTELGRALPGVRLYPHAVLVPGQVEAGHGVSVRLLAEEYTKFLAATVGVRPWLRPGDAANRDLRPGRAE